MIVREGNDDCRRDNDDADADGVKSDVDCKIEVEAMRRAGATKAFVDAIDAATIATTG